MYCERSGEPWSLPLRNSETCRSLALKGGHLQEGSTWQPGTIAWLRCDLQQRYWCSRDTPGLRAIPSICEQLAQLVDLGTESLPQLWRVHADPQ